MEENFDGEELDNIIILNDEEGNEVKFEFLDLIDLDDEEYVVLLPVTEEGEEEEGEVVILKVEAVSYTHLIWNSSLHIKFSAYL